MRSLPKILKYALAATFIIVGPAAGYAGYLRVSGNIHAVEPGVVRGGIRGHNHDADCQAFDRRQAERLGMRVAA